jgi:hypothetical protein
MLQVLEGIAHSSSRCSPGCSLKHRFCAVKVSCPQPRGHSVTLQVSLDLAPRLQLGSFAEFSSCAAYKVGLVWDMPGLCHTVTCQVNARSAVQDAWIKLSAGRSPELPQLQELLESQRRLVQASTCGSSKVAAVGDARLRSGKRKGGRPLPAHQHAGDACRHAGTHAHHHHLVAPVAMPCLNTSPDCAKLWV